MSHFAVAVIVHKEDDLPGLLAPYQENNMGDCPREYLEFVNVEKEYLETYKSSVENQAFAEEYPTFSDYMRHYAGYDAPDPETGKYGYWHNPNSKWDWWQIGGRATGWFRTKAGERVNACKLADLDTEPDKKEYKEALRFWEIVVEGAELLPGENRPFFLFKKSYYIDQYGSKEQYAAEQADRAPWAYITPDGKWHEKGSMGWFGMSDATMDSRKTYRESWKEAIASAEPTDLVVIVDCHI